MSDAVLLRPAAAADAPTLVALLHAAYAEYHGKLDPPSGAHAETEESVRRLLEAEQAVIAYQNERAVGCVFYAVESDHAHFHRLAVLPEARRQGIGRLLVEHVEQAALRAGRRRLTLGVRIALPGNRAFYEGLGYHVEAAKHHPGYAVPTWHRMAKELYAGQPAGSAASS